MYIYQTIKKHTGELLFLLGILIFIFNILNVRHTRDCGFGLPSLNGCNSPPEYHYNESTRRYVAIGAILIGAGILIIRHKEK